MRKNSYIKRTLTRESVFIVGNVSSVEGRRVRVRVNKNKNLSHISYLGELVKNVSVGSYVKITKGFIEMIGKVEGEYITKEKEFNVDYKKEELVISRYLDITLFGHFEGERFKQGIKEMPLIDNECFLIDKGEFDRLHKFHDKGEIIIPIGYLTEESSQKIELSVRKLFASHIGIFGNTGSGKSNTLARIYTELFRINTNNRLFQDNSRFVFIDFNGEYTKSGTITVNKSVYNLRTNTDSESKYPIKESNIESTEIISVLLEATEKTQKPFLDRAIKNSYLDSDFVTRSNENIIKIIRDILSASNSELGVSIFSEFFKHLSEIEEGSIAKTILQNIDSGLLVFHGGNNNNYYFKHGSKHIYQNETEFFNLAFPNLENLTISTEKFGKLKFKILSRYFHEIIHGYSNPEHIRPIIGRMFKKFNTISKVIEPITDLGIEGNNLEIINLKECSTEMKKVLPLIIIKQLYDDHKRIGDFEKHSLHIIIDEAHNILSSFSERESETWKDYRLETFEEIIKEGRKFSTFLTISSQRPYDISSTIISQLHNYFIHRLINDNDIKAIEKTIAYLDKLSFESIPVLSVGSCFVAGLASDIPIKVDISLLPNLEQPRSETINLQNAWFPEEPLV